MPLTNIDIGYGVHDPAFVIKLEQNLFHFSATETLAQCQAMNQALRESKNFSEFKAKAEAIVSTYRSYLKTEYYSAINTAEAASRYFDLKRKSSVYQLWQYKTAGDERVREEHAKLDGIVLRHDDPLWNKIFPPNGWRCRCYVVGILSTNFTEDLKIQQERVKEFMSTPEWEKEVAQGWGTNRALTAEIFKENQMYIRKFQNNAASYLKNITPDKWGLSNSIKKLQTEATLKISEYEGTAEQFWDQNKQLINGIEYLSFKDYLNKEWSMKYKEFNIHTSDISKSRSFRTKYLSEIPNILKDPDEVWLSKEFKDSKSMELTNYIYIKYYDGALLSVVCKVEKDKLKMKTFYEVKDGGIRKGLLIYKK